MPSHQTLGQQVYEHVRALIMSGMLAPGEKLTLRGLADDLSTSIQPVREAVARLAAERAVELAPNRLIRIPLLARTDLDELWAFRILLEGEAAALFAIRASGAEVEQLDAINRQLAAAYGQQDPGLVVRAVQEWGLALAAGARAPLYEATITNLRLRSAPHFAEGLRRTAIEDPAFLQFTVHIQDEFVLAVRARDGVRARDLRRADLTTFQRYLYRRLNWSDAVGHDHATSSTPSIQSRKL